MIGFANSKKPAKKMACRYFVASSVRVAGGAGFGLRRNVGAVSVPIHGNGLRVEGIKLMKPGTKDGLLRARRRITGTDSPRKS